MKNIIQLFIVSALSSLVLLGCGEDDGPKLEKISCDNPILTKEQKEEKNCFWDMGKPTDRSKNKRF